MPMVLAASCIPCPNAMAAAETVCAQRKPRLSRPGVPRRKIHWTAVMKMKPMMKPTSGDKIIGTTTASTRFPHRTVPAAPSVEPTNPPMSACDDDEGRPKYQVIRFQEMAPTTPAKTMPKLAIPVGSSTRDRKSTRLNSSHVKISYAVFCLKKKKKK